MSKSEKNGQKKNEPQAYHKPVLLKEVLDGLNIQPSGTYVDCTFGGGGHSRAILEKLNESGRLVCFDQDEDAKKNLPDDKRVLFVPENFRHVHRFLRLYKIDQVHGLLADLGVSSHQFDVAERGFSTRFDASLDMRMDKRQRRTAADVLHELTEAELHKIFERYGEISNSKTLAKKIVAHRQSVPIKTIDQLRSVL